MKNFEPDNGPRLQPDLSIVFEDKAFLKRAVPLVVPRQKRHWQFWGSVAAAAAVVAVSVLLLRPAADTPLVPATQPAIVAKVDPQPLVDAPVPSVEPVIASRPARAKAVAEPVSVQEKPVQIIEYEEFAPIATTGSLIAMTPSERSLTIQMERTLTTSQAAPQFNRSLYEMAAQALAEERPRSRQFFDEIGEKSIIAFNALAGHKTMVTKTYDAEGRLLSRNVTSLGMSMNREYEQQ